MHEEHVHLELSVLGAQRQISQVYARVLDQQEYLLASEEPGDLMLSEGVLVVGELIDLHFGYEVSEHALGVVLARFGQETDKV